MWFSNTSCYTLSPESLVTLTRSPPHNRVRVQSISIPRACLLRQKKKLMAINEICLQEGGCLA